MICFKDFSKDSYQSDTRPSSSSDMGDVNKDIHAWINASHKHIVNIEIVKALASSPTHKSPLAMQPSNAAAQSDQYIRVWYTDQESSSQ